MQSKKSSEFEGFKFALIAVFILSMLCGIACSSKSTTYKYSKPSPDVIVGDESKNLNSSQKRQTIANGFRQMAIESGKSTVFDTEGIEKKTMSVTSNTMEQSDCSALVKSDWSKTMTSVGFEKIICRNTSSSKEWSYTLTP